MREIKGMSSKTFRDQLVVRSEREGSVQDDSRVSDLDDRPFTKRGNTTRRVSLGGKTLIPSLASFIYMNRPKRHLDVRFWNLGERAELP